jgi:DNA replication licensing factor MCM2
MKKAEEKLWDSKNKELGKEKIYSNKKFFSLETIKSENKNEKVKKKISIKNWLKTVKNRDLIKHRFYCFLFGTNDERYGTNFYIEKIKNFFFYGRKSFVISFLHLVIGDPLLAIWLIDEPSEMLSIFRESCTEILENLVSEFFDSKYFITIRISELPIIDSMGKCESKKVNQFVKIRGVVVSKTEIYSDLTLYKLICLKCLEIQETVFSSKQNRKALFTICFSCKAQGPFQISWAKSDSSNFQKIYLQQLSRSNKSGGIPFKKEIILRNEHLNYVKLGEEITVTGILRYCYSENHISWRKNPTFTTNIDANYLEKTQKLNFEGIFNISEEIFLKKVFQTRYILKNLLISFMPSIYLDKSVKLPLLLSLFSCSSKKPRNFLWPKKGLHVLLIGDPSTGKTQILKAIEQVVSKSIYITSINCSTKGLTASLNYEKMTDDWVLEGGALVFADKGFCLIDEIEKLRIPDRVFLNEAMEHQFLKIKKGGTSNKFKTRCTIIATSLPIKDYYQSQQSIYRNFSGDENLLEKFDLILPLKDTADNKKDQDIAEFVVKSHQENLDKDCAGSVAYFSNEKKTKGISYRKKFQATELLPKKLLKKYIFYARNWVEPKINLAFQEVISDLYVSLRNEYFSSDSIRPSFKHLEIIIRLVESSARVHLREYILKKDLSIGFSVFLHSFMEMQPYSTKKNLYSKFGHFLDLSNEIFRTLLKLLKKLFKINKILDPNKKGIKKKKFEKSESIKKINKKIIQKFYESFLFKKHGFFIDEKNQSICHET